MANWSVNLSVKKRHVCEYGNNYNNIFGSFNAMSQTNVVEFIIIIIIIIIIIGLHNCILCTWLKSQKSKPIA